MELHQLGHLLLGEMVRQLQGEVGLSGTRGPVEDDLATVAQQFDGVLQPPIAHGRAEPSR
ncbi:hypothetical protein GTS_20960 [Gandjariella thermophila]|uniref:Uncharacterized protein n=1 Tax=Gandjariella thermophila TaxID=1931992 RepID=A0A4D4J9D3_9PSEU|nr:hypothetical protein [Gandjariella thermophila]GDY30463.1 hypothetical protein GTS_20960 [Gandjariella thermophila]